MTTNHVNQQLSTLTPAADTQPRPGRPLGLSLAILLCVMLYSVLPFALLGLDFMIQSRFQQFDDMTIPMPDGEELRAIAAGSDAELVNTRRLVIEAGLGLGFLVIAVFAWRGRPRWMRLLLMAFVLFFAAFNAYAIFMALTRIPSLDEGITSADGLVNSFLIGRLVITVLIPVYVVWYLNRAPARAFYRGYYLPAPDQTENESQGAQS